MAHIAPYSLHGDTIELVTKDYKRSQLQLCAFFARLELKKKIAGRNIHLAIHPVYLYLML